MNRHHLENIIKSGNLSRLQDYLVSCGFSIFEAEQIQLLLKDERKKENHPIAKFLIESLTDKSKIFDTLLILTRPAGSTLGNLPFAFMQRGSLFITGINFNPFDHKNLDEIWWTPIADADMLLFAQYTKKYAKRIAEGEAVPVLGYTKHQDVPSIYLRPIPSLLTH